MSDSKLASRRNFLKGTTAAAAGLTLSSLARSAHAAGSDKIKMALIGCGGRGSGAAENCLTANENVKIVAVADAFEGRASWAARKLEQEVPGQGRHRRPTASLSDWTPIRRRSTAAST